jgi:hypothetical protein
MVQPRDPIATWTWSAIDSRAEAATEVRCQRQPSLRERLFNWLIEFNKY